MVDTHTLKYYLSSFMNAGELSVCFRFGMIENQTGTLVSICETMFQFAEQLCRLKIFILTVFF